MSFKWAWAADSNFVVKLVHWVLGEEGLASNHNLNLIWYVVDILNIT